MLAQHEIEIRVRYNETDPGGYVHHANYFTYFEMGRTELLRASGGNYRMMEELGLLAVVVKVQCSYRRAAKYDDLLRLETTVTRVTRAKIEHRYRLFRESELLAVGEVTLAIINRQGELQPVPEELHIDELDA